MSETRTSAKRLSESVALADEKLRPYRRSRALFLRQYAGPYFAGAAGGAASRATGAAEPLNTIYSVVSVILPHLVSSNPRAMIRTPQPSLRETAEVFALAWNHVAARIDLGRSLRTVVSDALFGAGIMKTGLAPGAPLKGLEDSDGGSHLHDAGEVFADPVDLDDYVIDPFARRREEAAFEGDRYRADRAWLLESGLYDRAAVLALPAAGAGDGAPGGGDSLRAISPLADEVELIDLWLPREGVVVTLPAGEPASARYLREAPWDGPRRGPYELLGFHWVAGSPLPVPPVALWYDLHVLINKLARKQARAADRQKDLVLFDDRAGEEAGRLRDAFDGEMVGVQSVDRYRQVSFGAEHPETYQHLAFLFEQLSRVAGNVDLLGGLAPMSNTLGQDELLFNSASVRVEDMRSQVCEFVKHVGTKLAWFLWHDPLVDLPLSRISDLRFQISEVGSATDNASPARAGASKSGADATAEVPLRFSAATRKGEWLDYHFDVEPHSMNPDSPTRKYRRVLDWVRNVVLPTAPMAAEQGLKLDVARLARLTGSLLNIEEAGEIFVRGERKEIDH